MNGPYTETVKNFQRLFSSLNTMAGDTKVSSHVLGGQKVYFMCCLQLNSPLTTHNGFNTCDYRTLFYTIMSPPCWYTLSKLLTSRAFTFHTNKENIFLMFIVNREENLYNKHMTFNSYV